MPVEKQKFIQSSSRTVVDQIGAIAVQRTVHLTGFDRQNPVALNTQLIYTHDHNGWMALVKIDCSLPHNPLVPGSIPGCPIILSTSDTQEYLTRGQHDNIFKIAVFPHFFRK
jgi:hypothetical protein